ncbi:hypothetical protein ColTof4_03673 [Colletotrichum tofieldiae]|nr:hypothetical protein ColTof3_12900 [Colletotrichum tofieldiae]GKT71250.1 hypothetical protein ColTof4_03673 [Colletotrichum tofieldiae]
MSSHSRVLRGSVCHAVGDDDERLEMQLPPSLNIQKNSNGVSHILQIQILEEILREIMRQRPTQR